MSIENVIAQEAEAGERDPDAPIGEGATVSRGHGRTRTLQVRLTEDELAELSEAASARELPVSTLARDLILARLRTTETTPAAVIARLRADLETLASTVA